MIFSHRASSGLEDEKYGGRTLTSNSVGRCSLRRLERPPKPPEPSSFGESRTPAAMASSRRRRKRRRRKMPRMMMAEEMARRRKRVARNVNLYHIPPCREEVVHTGLVFDRACTDVRRGVCNGYREDCQRRSGVREKSGGRGA